MPYKRNSEVPDGVKVLPDDGITIWRKTFNAALKQYGDEETARKVAWAAVKKKYEKKDDEWVLKEGVDTSYEQTMEKLRQALNDRFQVGDGQVAPGVWIAETFDDFVIFEWQNEFYRADYVIDDQGNVVLSNVVEVKRQVEYEPVQEEALPRSVLISHQGPLTVLEEIEGGGQKAFRVRGVALVDDVVSANGYYYSREANDAIVEETTQYMQRGGKSTVYSRHEKARYGLPVGKVERLERVGKKVYFEGRIADTTEGRDVQVLITEGVLGPTSIRSSDFETRPVKIHGRQVMAVTRAILHGIDLVEQASIAGAGITEILTEGVVVEEVETEMDWKQISIDELKANRPDLLEAYDAAKYNGVNDKVRRLETELETEKARAKTLAEEHKAALTALAEEHQAALAALEEKHQATVTPLEEGQTQAIAQAVEEAKSPLLEQVQQLTAETEQRKLNEILAGAVKGKPHAELLEAALRNGMVFGEAKVEPCAQAGDVTEERIKAAEALIEGMKQALLVEKTLEGGSSFRGTVQAGESSLTVTQESVLELAK